MLQTEWNWMVAVDLLLSGAGAIALVIVSAMALVRPARHARTVAAGAWAGTVAVGIGVLFLLADVGQKLRALNLFASFSNFGTSWMPRGAWALTFTVVFGAVLALGFTFRIAEKPASLAAFCKKPAAGRVLKAVAVAEILLGCFVAFYTGMLVMSSGGVPFWATPFVPACFVAASVLAGAALVAAVAPFADGEPRKVVFPLAIAGTVAALALGGLVAGYLNSMLSADAATAAGLAAAQSAAWVVEGGMSGWFWGGFVVVGVGGSAVFGALAALACRIAPLGRFLRVFSVAFCICALVGGFLLRLAVLSAGLHAHVLVPDWYQAIDTSMFDAVTYLQH